MDWIFTLYIVLLFFLLTPGVLLRLPPNANKITVAATHAIVFGIVWQLTHKFVWLATVPHMIMPSM
uniref:Uncharacterized protein n=1 Tax=viral metagenome TaxID=1070528 RepID=A0A6C0LCU6_9ZZZZ